MKKIFSGISTSVMSTLPDSTDLAEIVHEWTWIGNKRLKAQLTKRCQRAWRRRDCNEGALKWELIERSGLYFYTDSVWADVSGWSLLNRKIISTCLKARRGARLSFRHERMEASLSLADGLLSTPLASSTRNCVTGVMLQSALLSSFNITRVRQRRA